MTAPTEGGDPEYQAAVDAAILFAIPTERIVKALARRGYAVVRKIDLEHHPTEVEA